MDSSSLVKDQIEDGRRLLEQLVRDGFDVTSAFWVIFTLAENERWFYLASKTVDQQGLNAAYQRVHESIRRMPAPWGPWLSVSEIGDLKLVGVNDPLANSVAAFHSQFPNRNRFQGARIGSYHVEDLYVYPSISIAVA